MTEMTDISEVIDATWAFWEDKISLIDLDKVYWTYMNNPEQYRNSNAVRLCKELTDVLFSKETVKEIYYMLSAMFRLTMIPEIYYELIRTCIDDDNLTKENLFFAYSQLAADRFRYPVLNTKETRDLLDELYELSYRGFMNEMNELCSPIPKNERNKDFVIVLTSQVLSLNHGPTKTLLDRCSILSEAMSKKVFIINTNSVLPEYGEINWFDQKTGNHIDEMNDFECLEWKGKKYGFFQCPREISQTDIIKNIIQIVKSEKPYFILSIGGEDMAADICAGLVPVLTVTLGPSERAQTRTTFQMTGHRIDDEDNEWLLRHGFETTHIIEGIFTSDFKPQLSTLARKDLGLPPDSFVCIVVGYRLDDEIDDTFLDVVRELAGYRICTAFMGKLDRYEEIVKDDELLRDYTVNLGFQDDALAVYECCDIYINPKRLGGGTSVAEAMSKGLPAVTIDYGDVAIGAGDDFTVKDYCSMIDQILKLTKDNEYYAQMSQKAKERAAVLTDSQGEFVRIIHEMESRKEFF